MKVPSWLLALAITLLPAIVPEQATAQSRGGHTPILSSASETSHVLKATPGTLVYIRGNNVAANAGYAVVVNLTAVPADTTSGLIPYACAKVAANGDFEIYPAVPIAFNVGISFFFTAATTCATRTNTGAPSGFINALIE